MDSFVCFRGCKCALCEDQKEKYKRWLYSKGKSSYTKDCINKEDVLFVRNIHGWLRRNLSKNDPLREVLGGN